MVFQNLLHEKPVVEVTFKNAVGNRGRKNPGQVTRYNVIGKVTEVEFTKDLGNHSGYDGV